MSDSSDSADAFGSSKRFLCQQCPKTFNRRYNLQAHVRSHTKLKPFVCPSCPESFVRKHDLHRHIASRHEHRVFGPCRFCGKSYSREDTFKRHVAEEEQAFKKRGAAGHR
eukprot:jgi/Hompol1/3164/HPOL_006378-RA